MAKETATEARFDFRGGLNLTANPDSVDVHELLKCENARVLPSGAVQRRAGITKLHAADLGVGGRVRGMFDAGVNTIAICNGNLYYTTTAMANPSVWTEVVPASGNFSTAVNSDFAMYRDAATGAPLVFIASGGIVYTYDPATHAVTRISGTNGVPNAYSLRVYGDRVFYTDNTNELTWSKIGDGTNCTPGGLSDGGSAIIGQDFRDDISALEVVGSSLLLATPSGVARFTGTGSAIRIDSDTFGVTADIGPVGTGGHSSAFRRIGDVVMMWTTRGPYIVTEGGITSLSEKLQTQGEAVGTTQWSLVGENDALVEDNPVRNEAWFLYKAADEVELDTALIYNYATGAVYGPFIFTKEIFSLAVSKVNGAARLIGGGEDGFVRLMDDNTASRDDDVDDYTHRVTFAPTTLGAGPHTRKSLRRVFVQTKSQSADSLAQIVSVTADGGDDSDVATLISGTPSANVPINLRYDTRCQGYRFTVDIQGSYDSLHPGDLPQILGLIFEGSVLGRL